LIATCLFSCDTVTPAPTSSLSSPLAPLTVTVPALTVTVTPAGTSITRFATLDMACSRSTLPQHGRQATMQITSPP
jgi:hypothetical protein